jgi:uridine kinase
VTTTDAGQRASTRIRTARAPVLGQVADYLVGRHIGHPLRVAVDGITASGKSFLAFELAEAIRKRGRTVITISGDDFHHQSAIRYRQGRHNANGYYEDAYDLTSLARLALAPLGPGGDLRYRARHHDLATDQVLHDAPRTAPADAVVLVDGTFLLKPELAGCWDEFIFVDTSFGEARLRGSLRDTALFGGLGRSQHAFDSRYHPASQRYLREFRPQDRATVVIENDDLARPRLQRLGRPAKAAT